MDSTPPIDGVRLHRDVDFIELFSWLITTSPTIRHVSKICNCDDYQ
jgi:hypothetical protein